MNVTANANIMTYISHINAFLTAAHTDISIISQLLKCLGDIHPDPEGPEKMPIIVPNRNLRPAPTNQYLLASVSKNFCKIIVLLCTHSAR